MKKFTVLLFALVGMISAMAQWDSLSSGTTNLLSSVFFNNANTGYVVGDSGTILKTTDGGLNWLPLNSGTSVFLKSVHFPQENIGYVVGGGGTILKTTDGGINWIIKNSGITYSVVSIYFTDTETGYAAGGGGVWASSGRLYKTTNGGESWSEIFSIGFTCFKVSFTSPDTGFIAAWDLAFGDVYYYISKTTDGGVTWNTLSIGDVNEYAITDVCFVDINTGYAVGVVGTILKTTDGGIFWTSLSSGTSETLNSVFFIDSTTGYVVGNNIILKTIDGGANWTSQSMEASGELLSVNFPSLETGYIVGDSGIILKTINGGGLGFNENGISSKFLKVFPNPATDKITISTTAITGTTQFSIFNVSGKKVLEMQFMDNETHIDISALPRGVYIVRVRNEMMVDVAKMIKE
jgi:photosystem II stability/assembly factor-like uncharacterized protein